MSPFRPPIATEQAAARGRFTLRPRFVLAIGALVLIGTAIHFSVRHADIKRLKGELLALHSIEIQPALNRIDATRKAINEILKAQSGSRVQKAVILGPSDLIAILKSSPVIYFRLLEPQWPLAPSLAWQPFHEDAILRCIGVESLEPHQLNERRGVVSDAWWKQIQDSKSPFFLKLMKREFAAAQDKERKDLHTLASAKYFVALTVIGGDHRIDPVHIEAWDLETKRQFLIFPTKADAKSIEVKNDFFKARRVDVSLSGEQNTLADCSIGMTMQNYFSHLAAAETTPAPKSP